MKVLRVVDWARYYENNRTKELKQMAWVPVPTKQDGDGYCTLVNHQAGAAHLGAWLAILQIAAKCEPRGTLLRDSRRGVAHTPQSLATISRLPAGLFQEVIPRLLDETGWLEEIEIEGVTEIPQEPAVKPQEGATIPQEGAGSRAHAEQNRTEEKRAGGRFCPARSLTVSEIQRAVREETGREADLAMAEEIQQALNAATLTDWKSALRRARARMASNGLLPELARDARQAHERGLVKAREMLATGKLGEADREVVFEEFPELQLEAKRSE